MKLVVGVLTRPAQKNAPPSRLRRMMKAPALSLFARDQLTTAVFPVRVTVQETGAIGAPPLTPLVQASPELDWPDEFWDSTV